jgi:hypothetical protein
MAKLTNTLPHGTPTNTDLFYSFSMFRMPQYLREVLAVNEYTTSRDMAVAADRVWDLRQSAPTAAVAAAYQPPEQSMSPPQRGRNSDRGRSQSQRRGRAQTPHTQEFPNNGICWYHNKYQNRSHPCRNPCNGNGPDARAGNGASLIKFTQQRQCPFLTLRFNVFERYLQPITLFSRLRSLIEHNTLFFFPNATWPKITWSKWRQHSHLGISNKNHQIGTTKFEHEFLLAKVAIPILGLDFFRKFQLSIHPLQCQVLDKAGKPISAIFAAVAPAAPTKDVRQPLSAAADMAAQTPLPEVSMSIPETVRRLLAKYPSIIRSETLTPTPTHGVEHVIDTGGNRPVFAKVRGLAPDKLRIAEAEFKKLEAAGIISRSNSAWASPLHMVPRRTAPGSPAATTGGSTPSQRQTGTLCQTCRTSPMA